MTVNGCTSINITLNFTQRSKVINDIDLRPCVFVMSKFGNKNTIS